MSDDDPDGPTAGASDDRRARLVGINHVALTVGDVDEALAWYGDLFAFELRGRGPSSAFLDMGDQFLAMSEPDAGGADERRHVGLVVDDAAAVGRRLDDLGVERLPTGGLDVRDPWGNRLQLVEYREVQFTKADHVLDGMDLDPAAVAKTDGALAELDAKGMAPTD
jgi:catechol 2,3-dioxygenase-like lactoylglutathione lyase family enzyme